MYFTKLAALILLGRQCSAEFNPEELDDLPKLGFGYTGETGPLAWGRMSSLGAQLCATGKQQSPINIDSKLRSILITSQNTTLEFNYTRSANASVLNTGLTVEVGMSQFGSSLQFDGTEYDLEQFHFHTPSEHRLSEEFYPLEMHFVHYKKGDRSNRLVLGVLFDLSENGNTTKVVQDLMSRVETIPNASNRTDTGPLDFTSITQHIDEADIYAYNGSFTVPPCDQGITWLVASKPLPLDVTSFNRAKKIMKFNSRYTQNKIGDENLLDFETEDEEEEK